MEFRIKANLGELIRGGKIPMLGVKKRGIASAIMIQVEEAGEDLHALARYYSLNKRMKHVADYVGCDHPKHTIARGGLKDIEAPCSKLRGMRSLVQFNAAPGDVVGSFVGGGGVLTCFVAKMIESDLKDYVNEIVKERILEEWVTGFLKKEVKIIIKIASIA